MLKRKIFHKKTRKGQIKKIVREHYLRDDVPCGLRPCASCPPLPSDAKALSIPDWPESPSTRLPHQHLIIPDTNILVHQMDVLRDPVFSPILILQTVWEEVKKRSPPSYRKMKEMVCEEEGRAAVVFVNEFHINTHVAREETETSNDRNDRAIRVAAKWYMDHLAASDLRVILVTDDVDNRTKATEMGSHMIPTPLGEHEDKSNTGGLESCSLGEYVGGMESRPELVEKMATQAAIQERHIHIGKGKTLFPEYASLAELQRGLTEGRYKQGSFQVNRENYLEAHVFIQTGEKTDGESPQVLVKGLLAANRAIQGDIVAIEVTLFPRLWK